MTCQRILDLLVLKLQINIGKQHVDNLFWLGKQKHNRPLLIKFTSLFVKSEIINRKNRLKGSNIIIQNDFSLNTRLKRNKLLVHMWKTRKLGKYAVLVDDRVLIDGVYYELEYYFEGNSNVKLSNTEQHVRGSSPTRLNLQTRQSEEASVSHYCESNSISTTEILRHKNVIDQQNSKHIQQKLDSSVAEELNKNWEEKTKQLEKIIYGHNSHTNKIDKNSKQQGGGNLPTRLNLPTRNSEVASVSNYGKINSVNTADLDIDKIRQLSKIQSLTRFSSIQI